MKLDQKEKRNSHIIHEFDRDKYTGNKQPMNIERVNRQKRLALHEPIEINIRHHIARRTAIGVSEDPLQVFLDAYIGSDQSVEDGYLLSV